MTQYSDRFLKALGAWQKGWREEPARRAVITGDLEEALGELRDKLPVITPIALCYRKRFLVPNNPQNGGDFVKLVMCGTIPEGPASWTINPEFHQSFKEIIREGQVTALFAHRPTRSEIVVDIPALWADPDFQRAVQMYADNSGEHADALLYFKESQGEMILNSPLLMEEVVAFVGQIGTYSMLFEVADARTEADQDGLHARLSDAGLFPGQARWVGKESAQRALATTRAKWLKKLEDPSSS